MNEYVEVAARTFPKFGNFGEDASFAVAIPLVSYLRTWMASASASASFCVSLFSRTRYAPGSTDIYCLRRYLNLLSLGFLLVPKPKRCSKYSEAHIILFDRDSAFPNLKVAVNTVVLRSPFFSFCTPKYRLLGRFLWEQNLVPRS